MNGSTRAFFATGLIALPSAALLQLLAFLGLPGAWPAMVHLTLFGWISAMIVAVNYHTLPVFSAREFPSPWLIWAHWALLSSGVALATGALLASWGAGLAIGLLLELASALSFMANTLLLFSRGARRPPPLAPPIVGQPLVDRVGTTATKLAGLALPLALLLLLAAQLGWVGGTWVLAAEHLATLGWVMLMVAGVAYHVLPRFSGRGTRGPAWARGQLACHAGALALIVFGLGYGWPRVFALGGSLMALALGLFAWTIWPTLRGVGAPSLVTLVFKERAR